jgi:hypothetical protein
VILIVTLGDFVSSIKYNVFKEGTAINTNIRAGRMVQMVSTSCLSIMNLLNLFLKIIEIIRYSVKITISTKITIA